MGGQGSIVDQVSLAVTDSVILANYGVDDIDTIDPGQGLVVDRGMDSGITVLDTRTNPNVVKKVVERVVLVDGDWNITLDDNGIPIWRDDPNFSHHGANFSSIDLRMVDDYPAVSPSPVVMPPTFMWNEVTSTIALSWNFPNRTDPENNALPALTTSSFTFRNVSTPLISELDRVPNVNYVNNLVNSRTLENLKPGSVTNQILYWDDVGEVWEIDLFQVERDANPKLGGNLDVSANTIYTLDNNDIIFFPDSGRMIIDVPGDAIITTSPGESLYLNPSNNLWLKQNAWPNNIGLAGQVVTSSGDGFTTWATLPSTIFVYDISYYLRGSITDTSSVYGSFIATRSLRIDSPDTSSRARCKVASAGTVVYNIVHSGVTVGTVTFSVGNVVGVISVPAQINILAGDLVEIVTTGTIDSTIRDVSITLAGVIV